MCTEHGNQCECGPYIKVVVYESCKEDVVGYRTEEQATFQRGKQIHDRIFNLNKMIIEKMKIKKEC